MKKLELNLLDAENLINFITKFRVIDKNIMLKIYNDKIVAKSFKEDVNLIKYGEIEFDNLFTFVNKKDKIEEPIKLWVYNIDKFKSALNIIGNCKFIVEIDDDLFATKIELKSRNIKKTIPVLNNLEFNEIEDEKIIKLFDKSSTHVGFEIEKNFLLKLKALNDLENENYFYISIVDNVPIFYGSEFELKLETEIEKNKEVTQKYYIDKSIFKYIDLEDQEIYLKDNAILLFNGNFKIASSLLENTEIE